ncbi:hypothetical protein MMC14_006653 [Varicellaria rhodocarpa]|nr:hypothetical protein [Varicellaria rhodocarpa]
MLFSLVSTLAVALSLLLGSQALNIIVNNDDGFGSANIREFYRLLRAAGHDAWIVAPVVDNSGQGGRSSYSTSPTLLSPSEYNLVPAGSPAIGTDPNDSHIWYYNGTPAACTFVALDYVVPRYTNWTHVDLLVAGPNFGDNLGPFLYTLSGTLGATYAAVGRNIPAIGFSAGNGGQRSFTNVTNITASGYPDPATIAAQLSVNLVNQLAANTPPGKPLLPLGYGLNVNYPYITSFTNSSCVAPPFIQTRLTGGADIDTAVFNATSRLFTYGNIVADGVNACINGDCSLPGETNVVSAGCQGSVSVFTVDYDAPISGATNAVRKSLQPLVSYANGTGNGTVLSRRSPALPRPQRANRVQGLPL